MLHATRNSSDYPYSELDSDTDSDKPLLYDTPLTVRFSEPQTKRRMGFRKWFSRSSNEKRPLIDRITTPMDEILTDEPPTTTDALTSPPRGNRKYRDQQREEYERRQHYERTRERERDRDRENERDRERDVDRYSVPRRQIQDSARWHEHVRQQQQHQQPHMQPAHQIPSQAHQIPHQIPPGLNQHMHPAYLHPRQISQIGQMPRTMSGYHNQSLLRPMSQVLDPRYYRTEGYPVPAVTYAQVPQGMQAEIVELKDDSGDDKKEEKKEDKSKKEDKGKKEDKKEEKKDTEDSQSQSAIEKVVKKALQNHRPAVYETLVRMNSFVLSLRLALCIACVAFYPLVGILLIVVLFGSEILLELAIKCGPDRS